MPELGLVDTADLLHELKNRYAALIVLGVHADDTELTTEILDGPAFWVAGLMAQACCQMAVSMAKPLEDDDE
jgi:hypothetical protein